MQNKKQHSHKCNALFSKKSITRPILTLEQLLTIHNVKVQSNHERFYCDLTTNLSAKPMCRTTMCVLGTFTILFASCYIALVIKSSLIFSYLQYNLTIADFKCCLHSWCYNHFIKLCVQWQGCKVCVQVCAKKWQWKLNLRSLALKSWSIFSMQ